jgi:hypothetical protein
LSCLVFCLVLSCLVLSCLVLSCLVLLCLVLSRLVLSCLALSCLVSCKCVVLLYVKADLFGGGNGDSMDALSYTAPAQPKKGGSTSGNTGSGSAAAPVPAPAPAPVPAAVTKRNYMLGHVPTLYKYVMHVVFYRTCF